VSAPETFEVPADVVQRTHDHLRVKGATREEGVVLWRGTFEPPRITGAIVPLQDTSEGRFRVSLEERQRISRQLSGTGEMIVAQVHSHPNAAFHSWIDDKEAIPRRVGAYSLVVPDFGARAGLLDNAALYQLDPSGGWRDAPLDTFRLPLPLSSSTAPRRKGLRWLIATAKNFGRSRT
jgi:hypothetical protein